MLGNSAVARLVDATPASRDRYMDFLRAFSIAVVVFGHWLMAIVYLRDGGRLEAANALDVVPGLWVATWVLQVMPLFFFVGGFSNFVGWKSVRARGDGYADFIRSRIARLMRPTLVFVGAWTAVAAGLSVASPDSWASIGRATELLAKPLWFLAVYVLVVALAPLMLAVHERYGVRALLGLGAAAVVVDVIRVAGDATAIGYLNFAFVWLFAHQLGFFYADGALTAFSRRVFGGLSVVALATLALLTGSGIYSPSMVGMQTDAASNNSPPSVCLIVLTLWLVSAAMLLRPAASRWLQRRRVWAGVVVANSMIMTVFLWHLTALAVGVLVLYPIGFPQPEGGSALWWAWRPIWLVALTTLLAPFVMLFARFERGTTRRRAASSALGRFELVGGISALVLGLAGLAQFGFAQAAPLSTDPLSLFAQPLVNAALVVVGYHALASSKRSIGG